MQLRKFMVNIEVMASKFRAALFIVSAGFAYNHAEAQPVEFRLLGSTISCLIEHKETYLLASTDYVYVKPFHDKCPTIVNNQGEEIIISKGPEIRELSKSKGQHSLVFLRSDQFECLASMDPTIIDRKRLYVFRPNNCELFPEL